ncbi:hypothetical protein DUT91_17755 [Phyllobacterium salinisoli]|uniref:Uncharacterized protein n=1 Tax=Phyllobacterium salinisoli TaxID=1899321 RepID=A0A368K0G2_9HYPH|nr:hypothetical protein DUT91_17755 [Phyllobacterium salinisoli]
MIRAPDHRYDRAVPGMFRLVPSDMRKKLEVDYARPASELKHHRTISAILPTDGQNFHMTYTCRNINCDQPRVDTGKTVHRGSQV